MGRTITTVAIVLCVAIAAANEVVRLVVDGRRRAAEAAFAAGDLERSRDAYARARALAPREPYAYIDEADAIVVALDGGLVERLGEEEVEALVADGIRLYLDALRLSPPSGWSYHGIGKLLGQLEVARTLRREFDLANLDDATSGPSPTERLQEAFWARSVDIEPTNFHFRDHLAEFYLRHGFEARAAEQFREAIRIHPFPDNHYFVPALLERSPIVRAAAADGMRAALEGRAAGDLDVERVRRALAEVHLLEGRADDARAELRIAAEIGRHPQIHELRIGQTLMDEQRYAEAAGAFRRAAAADPGWFRPWWMLGLALDRDGRHDEAIESLRRGRSLAPGRYHPGAALARALENAGRTEEAGKVYAALIEEHPDRESSYLRRIEILRRDGREGEAARVARRLADRFPEIEIYSTRADQLESGLKDGRP